MNKITKILFNVLLIIFITSPICINAKQTGSLCGKITDKKTGKPLSYVNIIVKGTNIGVATNLEGKYTIPCIPTGSYTIIASIIGYKCVEKKVDISFDRIKSLDFMLDVSPLEMVKTVVTGTRTSRYIKDIPIRTEVITDIQIKEKAATNLYEVLDGLPGIRVEQQCSYCNFSIIRLEGLGADHTQILIDGQPIFSGLASVYGLQQIPTVNIDRIEIIKGAGSALYGSSAIAGAMNIISKTNLLKSGADVGFEYGLFNTHKYSVLSNSKIGNNNITFKAQKYGGDIIDQSGDEGCIPDGISDRVKTDNLDAGFRIVNNTINNTDKLIFSTNIYYESRRGGILENNLYMNPFSEGTERIITRRNEANFLYNKYFNSDNKLDFSFAYSNHNRNATNDTYLTDYMSIHSDSMPDIDEMMPYLAVENLFNINLNYSRSIYSKHNILFGTQYLLNKLREKGKYIVVDENSAEYGKSYMSTSEKSSSEIGVYIQDEFLITPSVEIVMGVRYDFHYSVDEFHGSGDVSFEGLPASIYSKSSLNPRFAFRYSPFNFLTLRSSIGTGYRVPYGFSEDLHLCSGSPRVWKGLDLEPEKSVSFNISADYNITNFIFGISLYRTNLKNKIGFVEAGGFAKSIGYTYEWKNIDDAYVQGIEFSSKTLIVKHLILNANFTINDGKYKHTREDWINTDYEEVSRYISRFPMYTGGLNLTFNPNKWNFNVEANYQGFMYIDYFKDDEVPVKIKKTEPNIIVNAKISRKFYKGMELFIGGKNLTDYIQPERHNDQASFIYAPLYGRMIYGGLNIHF